MAAVSPALLVPVTVEALVLTTDMYSQRSWSWVVPSYKPVAVWNPVTPAGNPSAPEINTPDAQLLTDFTGVVVRWALPDGLTTGLDATPTGESTFRPIPNRWLVVRTVADQASLMAAWVVASDVFDDDAGSPYPPGPVTAIGKAWPLAEWPGESGIRHSLTLQNTPLTAVGPGDATFAAYVPNVQNVLAVADALDGIPAGTISYAVCGWYSDAALDPLTTWTTEHEWERLLRGLAWSLGDTADLAEAASATQAWCAAHAITVDADEPTSYLPRRSQYHGLVYGLTWQGPNGPVQSGVPDPSSLSVAVGNSGIDALGQLIADHGNELEEPDGEQVVVGLTALLDDQLGVLQQTDGLDQLAVSQQHAWFQSLDGGTIWVVRDETSTADPSGAAATSLTAPQQQALAALNLAQQQVDAATRTVTGLQRQLYDIWCKWMFVTETRSNPIRNAKSVLDNLLDDSKAAVASSLSALTRLTTARDTALASLEAVLGDLVHSHIADQPFSAPSEPVVLITGVDRGYAHGEDGRYTKDGSLFCRFSGQEIASIRVGTTTVTPASAGYAPPATAALPVDVADLLAEAFLLDPGNAAAIAAVADPPAQASAVAEQQTAMQNADLPAPFDPAVVAADTGMASAYGTVTLPSEVAVQPWAPPWSPLYLDWQLHYNPTGSASDWLAGWTFPGAATSDPIDAITAQWSGGPVAQSQTKLQARTLITPQVARSLSARLGSILDHFGDTPEIHPLREEIADAIEVLSQANVLSQALSGLNAGLLQHDGTLFLSPGNALDEWLSPPGGPPFLPDLAPSIAQLPFAPVRAGFIQFSLMWVVDAFGQVFDVMAHAQGLYQGNFPITTASDVGPPIESNWFAVKPRIVAPCRLRFRYTDASDATRIVGLDPAADPVCGWMVRSLLDDAFLVYDAAGVLRGEVVLAADAVHWVPAPDLAPADVTSPEPDIGDARLAAIVTYALTGTQAFSELANAFANSEWALTAPPSTLSTALGSPVAVLCAALQLEFYGAPAVSQAWPDLAGPTPVDGDVDSIPWPVQLGSCDLLDDGLIGYFDAGAFVSPYGPTGTTTVTAGSATTVTMLVHPDAAVHAFSGAFPPLTLILPAQFQAAPLAQMEATFRAGPLLTPPTAIAAPVPAFARGNWSFLAYPDPTQLATPVAIAAVDQFAHLPDSAPVVREGWLRLVLGTQPTKLSYAVTPQALNAGQRDASIVLSAYNASGEPVGIDSVTVTVPADLATRSADVTLAAPQAWVVKSVLPGVFRLTPPGSVRPGDTIVVPVGGLRLPETAGQAAITITETVGGASTSVTLYVERVLLA